MKPDKRCLLLSVGSILRDLVYVRLMAREVLGWDNEAVQHLAKAQDELEEAMDWLEDGGRDEV